MMSKNKLTFLVLFLSVAFVLGAQYFYAYKKSDVASKKRSSRSKGNPNSPVIIREYIDFQCPPCAKGVKIIDSYQKNFPNKIYVEIKYFPVPKIHRHAMLSSIYAECAARQNKFWPYLNLLVKFQRFWSKAQNARDIFHSMGEDTKLNLNKLNSCLKDDRVPIIVQAEKKQGKEMGVQATPTYFINDKMFVGTKKLKKELDRLLGPKKIKENDENKN